MYVQTCYRHLSAERKGPTVRLVIEFGRASTSLLQRRLPIGYGRAAHLIDLMEKDGMVGAADGPQAPRSPQASRLAQ